MAVADPGGPDPPFGDVGGPKSGPKMDPSGGSRVQGPPLDPPLGFVCVTGVITPPPPLGQAHMWMTSHWGLCV